MNCMSLSFDASGVGTCFYTEAIPLNEIGALEITRASTIEFNRQSQQWEVKDKDGATLHSNPSRQQCLQWEHQHFNQ
jgi:hypothetical protein